MRRITLKEKAYLQLRSQILNGEFAPGEYLTEARLTETLGMSRTPIRAALERLDVEKLATYTPNRGLIVSELTMNRVVDSFDFRKALECHVVRKLAKSTWSEDELGWFRNNLENQIRYIRDEDYIKFTEADLSFHRQLISLYGNKEILNTFDLQQLPLHHMALSVLRKDQTRIKASYDDHLRIFTLIEQGHGEQAAAMMERHLEYGIRILIS